METMPSSLKKVSIINYLDGSRHNIFWKEKKRDITITDINSDSDSSYKEL